MIKKIERRRDWEMEDRALKICPVSLSRFIGSKSSEGASLQWRPGDGEM